MTRSSLVLALSFAPLAACHHATSAPTATAATATTATAPATSEPPADDAPAADTPQPAASPPEAHATGTTTSCGLAIFETARGTHIALPGAPRVSTERLGAFDFLSHVYEANGLTLELDEFRLPTDTGDGRAILEPLANGQVAAQAEWQVVANEQRTIAGSPALVRAYRLEDGTERREVYVARHRLAVRLVTESIPPTSDARHAIVQCFESSLALPPDVR